MDEQSGSASPARTRTSVRRSASFRTLGARAGIVIAVAGSAIVTGWLTGSRPLASLYPGAAPARVSTGFACLFLGLGVHAAGNRLRRTQMVSASAAVVVALTTIFDTPAGIRLGIDGLLERLLPALTDERLVGTDAPTTAALIAGLTGAILLLDVVRPTARSALLGLSMANGIVIALAFVDLAGRPLARPAGGLLISAGELILLAFAAVAIQLVLSDRVGAFHSLFVDRSVRSSLLRGFALPIPLITIGPLVAAVVLLQHLVDDPAGARIVARIGAATVVALIAAATLIGRSLADRFVAHLTEISDAAGAVAEGDFEHHVPADAPGELGELVRHFEAMRSSLADRAGIEAFIGHARRRIIAAPDIREGARALGDAAAAVVAFDRTSFAFRRPDGAFELVAVREPAGWLFPADVTLPESITTWPGAEAGELAWSDDTLEPGQDPIAGAFAALGTRSFLALPSVTRSTVHGLVLFESFRPARISDREIRLLSALARESAGAFRTLMVLERERDAAEDLRKLDQLKNDFVGIVAHDLRSPMTVIAGFADTLARDWERIDPTTREDFLNRIVASIQHLSTLVEDVLQVARIDAGKLTFNIRPFEVGELVSRVAKEAQEADPSRATEVHVPDDLPRALGDAHRQWQILTNLVGNATKFSRAGTPIHIGAERENGNIRVFVRDHGVGIEPADLDQIWERFSRVRPPDGGAKPQGTGLGLYIVRSMVEAQGGTVSVSSTPGEGSTFSYTVPIATDTDEGGSE
ncbi:MAG TPA: ATP-binding protein [Actinomycetota bacterium]